MSDIAKASWDVLESGKFPLICWYINNSLFIFSSNYVPFYNHNYNIFSIALDFICVLRSIER